MKRFPVLHLLIALLIFGLGVVQAQQDSPAAPSAMPEDITAHIPFLQAWLASPHADAESVAFTNWDAADPPLVPVSCAKCHSGIGHQNFLGVDGTAFGEVTEPAQPSVITCTTCHNEVTQVMDSVTMPSGMILTGLGNEAVCMNCHQGRSSTTHVNAAIERLGIADDDADVINPELAFLNIHYYAAAATNYGTWAKGGYEYAGRTYDAKFMHVEGFDSCTDCHNPHSLELRVDACSTCHFGVETRDDLRDIRMEGSMVDFDGDGSAREGIYYEIQGLQEILYANMLQYAADVVGTPIVYSPYSHPYFFIDLDGDGQVSEGEATRANAYNAWTPRLLRAAYNYQVSRKDPGAFAHGPRYIIQLLYDSTEDIVSAVDAAMPSMSREATPEALAAATEPSEPTLQLISELFAQELDDPHAGLGMMREPSGHFTGAARAWRYWDEAGIVPATCSKCHTATGLPFFLAEGANVRHPPSNGLRCTTCHTDLEDFEVHNVPTVRFPSGAVLSMGESADNICMNCHQGRESTVSVNNLIAGLDRDAVSERLSFLNVHYFASAATRFGTEAKGAYEYDGKDYVGFFHHTEDYNTCTQCHQTHQLEVRWNECQDCHDGIERLADLRNIRETEVDFDGDGDTEKGLYYEIATLRGMLYEALQDYAIEQTGVGIIYAHAHPYYFIDTDLDRQPSPGEAAFPNRFNAWTPRLLQAAYNYQYSTVDPGTYAHNGMYILQVLYDSLEDLGADVSGLTRPTPDMQRGPSMSSR